MDKKYGIPNIELVSRYCYYAGLGIGLIGLVGAAVIYAFQIHVSDFFPGCAFYLATGYYCPGCGGTRAVIALSKGEIAKSLHYHPFVIYMFVYYLVYEASHSLELVTRGKIKGVLFCPPFFYVGIVIVVVQWLIKNYLKFQYGLSL